MDFGNIRILILGIALLLSPWAAYPQLGMDLRLPGSIFPNKCFESGGQMYMVGDWGALSKRHYEIFELRQPNTIVKRFVSADGRAIWKFANDEQGNVFVSSFYAVAPPQKYFISALNSQMELKWEYELQGSTLTLTSIVPDEQGGCFLACQMEDELKCLHLNSHGHCDWTHSFGQSPISDYIFELDLAENGLTGFVTTRSELTGVVNRCTPDYDYLGFARDKEGPIDTVFFNDVDPYSNFLKYEVMPSPIGGNTFLWRAKLIVEPTQSSIQVCDDLGKEVIDFRNPLETNYPLRHGNRMAYSTRSKSILVVNGVTNSQNEVPIDERWGYPQRAIASQGEDGIIWNAIGSDAITKYSLNAEIIWMAKIPYALGTKASVIQIGYRGAGGYFIVTQTLVGGQQCYFELDANGHWIR